MALGFLSCVQTALLSDSYDHFFFEGQRGYFFRAFVLAKRFLLTVLPTGYGKYLDLKFYRTCLLKDEDARKLSSQAGPLVNLNVPPLNSLMYDQINFRVLLTFNSKYQRNQLIIS